MHIKVRKKRQRGKKDKDSTDKKHKTQENMEQ